jgi:type VI secretion system protein ImpG
MTANEQEELLRHYEQELTHLRRMGVEFARKYPKVAGRLELSPDQCADPYVERMIESFAYLTARIRHNIESEFPQVPSALLSILYPHYLNPVPSMSIARFEVDPTQGKLTSGYTIDTNTSLFAQSHQGQTIRFRTCYPVTLWPVDVSQAALEPVENFELPGSHAGVAAVLRIRIEHRGGTLGELDLKSLRFFINGEPMRVYSLYEMIFGSLCGVAILPEGSTRPITLPIDSIRPVGFGSDENVLPYPSHSHPQYRLLQEYFSFPEKFLFFDIDNLERHASEGSFDILLLVGRVPKQRPVINRDTFALGCTPIINLFSKTTEPIRINHLLPEYQLVPDMRREATTEIYSINSVSGSSESDEDSSRIEPFYSFNHQSDQRGAQAFWFARRTASERQNIPGTEMFLSFVDLGFKPLLPPTQTVFAHTLCTNRHSASALPTNAELNVEEATPIARVYCVTKPTRQIDPPLSGMAYWRLVSHLSLNYLSLSDGQHSLKALQEILGLYTFVEEPSRQHQIMGIREMSTRKVIRRVGKEAWRGFVQGTEITLEFDETRYVGSSAFLMASVLNRYFALYTSINSFTQLVARSAQREGIWKQWPPMVGEQFIL